MPTNAQLQAEVERLRTENEDLRTAATPAAQRVPLEPSFGMSEGTRNDLEVSGVATDPFTGRRVTAEDYDEDDEYEDDED